MKNRLVGGCFSASLVMVMLLGCRLPVEGPEESEAPEASGAALETGAEVQPDPQAGKLELERAIRRVDRLEGLAEVRKDLEALLRDGRLSPDDQAEAYLTLSRAADALGDREGAITTLEDLLALRASEERSNGVERAERALRFLLTGHEDEQDVRLPASAATAPIANALAGYFTADDTGRVLVDVLAIGMGSRRGPGIYDIAEAKRSVLEQDLTAKVNIARSISSDDWMALPRTLGEKRSDMPHPDRSLLVFYFDLGDRRVPSRYDEYLPIPSDEIVARLERGEAFVAARQRPNGRPTIVLAAPRAAQLELVEEAFTKMTALPVQPVTVPIENRLLPTEIQGHVRRARGAMAKCYEDALKRVPTLSGKITLAFEIDGAGRVGKLELEPVGLDEPALLTCVRDVTEGIRFPATGGPSLEVHYPIAMTP
jgi:hypothetical protein